MIIIGFEIQNKISQNENTCNVVVEIFLNLQIKYKRKVIIALWNGIDENVDK